MLEIQLLNLLNVRQQFEGVKEEEELLEVHKSISRVIFHETVVRMIKIVAVAEAVFGDSGGEGGFGYSACVLLRTARRMVVGKSQTNCDRTWGVTVEPLGDSSH